jgi:hypothetical protein
MAHFAKLDSNNIVTKVHKVANHVILKADNTESELKGKQYLNSLHGSSTWVQTSYNNNFRKNFARIGYTYDNTRDAFIPPKPYSSWVLNESTCRWEAPVAHPDNNQMCEWDEDNQQWINCENIPTE